MTAFTSKTRNLILQDDKGVWAEFVDHAFETDDKDVAARLRKVDGVTEGEAPVEAVAVGEVPPSVDTVTDESDDEAAADSEPAKPAKKAAAKKAAADSE